MVHIHNGTLLSYWKEYIWISSNETDETGAYYTEWISQKEKHEYHISTLKARESRWSYVTDRKCRRLDSWNMPTWETLLRMCRWARRLISEDCSSACTELLRLPSFNILLWNNWKKIASLSANNKRIFSSQVSKSVDCFYENKALESKQI